MKNLKFFTTLSCLGVSVALLFLFFGVSQVGAEEATSAITNKAKRTIYGPLPEGVMPLVSRPRDPVIIPASALPTLIGLPIADIRLYSDLGAGLVPIPFQIDQKDGAGIYQLDDGDGFIIDANDDLVFMAFDAGDPTTCGDSTVLLPSTHDRLEIEVTDPLDGTALSNVYIYTDNSLATSPTSYMSWDQVGQTATAGDYSLTFGSVHPTSVFLGVDDLVVGGVDLLDRQKLFLDASGNAPIFGCIVDVKNNEEELTQNCTTCGGIDPTVFISVTGPIRAVTNDGALQASFYKGRLDITATFTPPAALCGVERLRTSFDMSAASNLTNYYNSNNANVTIDGVGGAEGIDGTLLIDWMQYSGASANAGIVFAVPSLTAAGTQDTFYLDQDPGCNPPNGEGGDTGDGACRGDSGIDLVNPGLSPIDFTVVAMVLPGNDTTNVGQENYNWIVNPLETNTITSQNCVACAAPNDVTNAASAEGVGPTDVALSWDPVTGGADEYVIYRDSVPYAGGAATEVGTVPGAQTMTTDTGFLGNPATNYFYYISARNSCGADSATLSNHIGEFDFAIIPGS